MEHNRGSWGSNLGFLMAAIGSAGKYLGISLQNGQIRWICIFNRLFPFGNLCRLCQHDFGACNGSKD